MYSIYQAGIRIYFFLARLFSAFSPRVKEFLNSRSDQRKHRSFKRPGGKRLIWFHASSLGEYEQGQPLIRKWKELNPDWIVLLTFFSPSGFKNLKNSEFAHYVDYIPIDTGREVRRFLDYYQPDVAVFIKYDIWPVMLRELRRNSIPAFLVSAVFRNNQLFFRWYGKWYLSVLRDFTRIFTQDAGSVRMLNEKSINNAQMAGDTRIDRVIELAGNDVETEGIREFIKGSKVLIAGSSWPAEEKLINLFIRSHNNKMIKVILAPHDISEKRIESIKNLFGKHLITYAGFLKNRDAETGAEVLLLDSIGLLSRLYRYGDIAFIGGAFGKGLHNVLEPAVYGLPVIFGPSYKKFVEAVELVNSGAAFPVKDSKDFISTIGRLTEDNYTYLNASKGCKNYVNNNAGATGLIIRQLLEFF